MAWTLLANVQGNPPGTGGDTSPTFDSTGADLITVNVEGVPPFAVTDNMGNTYTARTVKGESQLWDCINPAGTGAGHTVTMTGLVANLQVQAWQSPAGAVSFDVENGATGSLSPGSVTPANNDSLLVCGGAGQNTQTYTIDSGFTISDQFPGSGVAVPGVFAYLNLAVAAATNPAWVVTGSGSFDTTIAVYAPVSVGVGARTAQIMVEALSPADVGLARTAQIMVEALAAPNPGLARTAQIMVEVLHSITVMPGPVTGGTAAWFKVLEGDIFTDRDLVD